MMFLLRGSSTSKIFHSQDSHEGFRLPLDNFFILNTLTLVCTARTLSLRSIVPFGVPA